MTPLNGLQDLYKISSLKERKAIPLALQSSTANSLYYEAIPPCLLTAPKHPVKEYKKKKDETKI
jgi:hypothetical protein